MSRWHVTAIGRNVRSDMPCRCGGERPRLGRRGPVTVAPEAGTVVVFDAFHGHEVLPSKRRRFALTLWLFAEPR